MWQTIDWNNEGIVRIWSVNVNYMLCLALKQRLLHLYPNNKFISKQYNKIIIRKAGSIPVLRDIWRPFQYVIWRFIVRSWSRQICITIVLWACQISNRCDNLYYQCRNFETSRYLIIRRRLWYGGRLIWRMIITHIYIYYIYIHLILNLKIVSL